MSKEIQIRHDKLLDYLLVAEGLHKTYSEGKLETQVLKGISFKMKIGDMAAIVGSSGSGKSTLLHLLGGLDTPTKGKVIFNGQPINQLSEKQKALLRYKDIGFIYQFHHLLSDFTALENVAMPLLIAGIKFKEAKERAMSILASINLSSRAHHRPAELSGGERQRVAIGRALINNPALVMADEPTGNLDKRTAEGVFDLLLTLNKKHNTALLVVTHDLSLAKKLSIQLKMSEGKLTQIEHE